MLLSTGRKILWHYGYQLGEGCYRHRIKDTVSPLTWMRTLFCPCYQLKRGCLHCQHGGQCDLIISSLKEIVASLKENVASLRKDAQVSINAYLSEEIDKLKEEAPLLLSPIVRRTMSLPQSRRLCATSINIEEACHQHKEGWYVTAAMT